MTEGVDVPGVETVFLARPTISSVLMTQMIGRGLRGPEAGGKRVVNIVSFIDNWKETFQDAWVNPEKLFIELTADFNDKSKETERQIVRLVSIHKIEEFARMLDKTVNTTELKNKEFIERIPVGLYSFSYLDPFTGNVEPREKFCEILIYDNVKKAYSDFVSSLPEILYDGIFPDDNPHAEEFSNLAKQVEDEYFFNIEKTLGFRREDIEDILKLYFYDEKFPKFVEFRDREKFDVKKVAEKLMSMETSEEVAYVNQLWADEKAEWQAFLKKYCEVKFTSEVKRSDTLKYSPTRYGLDPGLGKKESFMNVFFSAARDIEPALEIKRGGGIPRGAFTLSLVKGLSGLADLNKDGAITYRELYNFTKSSVKYDGLTQIPQLDPAPGAPAGSILDQPVFRSGAASVSAQPLQPAFNATVPDKTSHADQPHVGHTTETPQPPEKKPPLVSKPPPEKIPQNWSRPNEPPTKTDSNIINIFLEEDLEPSIKGFFKDITYIRFCDSPETRDISLRLKNEDEKFSGSVLDLSDLVTNRFIEASRENLAIKLGPVFEGRFLQKKLGNLTTSESPFHVKLEVLGNPGKFHEGEKVVYSFSISHDCFFYLIDIQPDGRVNLLFPNPYRRENFLKAGNYTLPEKADKFDFEVTAPFGNELVKAIGIKDKEAAKKLGLPVPGDDFISFEGNPFAENSKSREFVTAVESDVTEIGNTAASEKTSPISLSQVTYQTKEHE